MKSFLSTAILLLTSQHPRLLDDASKLFHANSTGETNDKATAADLLALFATSITKVGGVTIVIDALDECTELEEFVSTLTSVMSGKDATVRILITSRPDYAVQKSLGDIVAYRISLEHKIQRDIQVFVTGEVNARIAARKIRIRSADLRDHIIHTLSCGAAGMLVFHFSFFTSCMLPCRATDCQIGFYG